MSQRGPDMSPRDMRRLRMVRTIGRVLCGLLGCCGPARHATTAAYASPHSDGPIRWLLLKLVHPWIPAPRSRHRTGARAQGNSKRARTGRLCWNLVSFPVAHGEIRRIEGGQSLTPETALTLKDRSARRNSLEGRKGLLASRHCFPQRPKREWGNLNVGQP